MTTDGNLWASAFYEPAEVPTVVAYLGALSTTRGEAKVFRTTDPFPQPLQSRQAYVAVLCGSPLMFVTFLPGSEGSRYVHAVWARDDVRGQSDAKGGDSIPVQVGKWLFTYGHLTHHSEDRTPSGDRWAHRVGGVIPPLLPEDDPKRGNPDAAERASKHAYDQICKVEWGAALSATDEVPQ